MKIRFLIADAFVAGGTVSTTLTNASALATRGHDVEVVSVIRARDSLPFPLDQRVHVSALVDLRGRLSRWDRRRLANPSSDVPTDERRYELFNGLTDRRIAAFLHAVRDGVVVATRPALNLALARHGRASVAKVGQEHLFMGRQQLKPLLFEQMREWYPRLDAFVSLTRGDAADYARTLRIRTTAIPNAVRDLGPAATSQVIRDSSMILAAGRLTRQKGFDRLIEAMALVGADTGWRAQVYGVGRQEENLRKQISTTGAPVDLMGFTFTLPEEMRSSALFAMPSRYEGFPMVMLEAMGAGLPVVTFDFQTGAADLVQHGVNGLLVRQDDVPGFAQAVGSLIADPERRVALGQASRQTALAYTSDALAGQWEGLFESLTVT